MGLAVLALSVALSSQSGQAPTPSSLPLPPASGALEFAAGETEIPLSELLRRFARLTGAELVMSPQTRQLLEHAKEPLEGTSPVPAAEVYAYVEGLLSAQDVVIAPLTGGTRPLLAVTITRGGGQGGISPLHVSSAAMGELAGHPALLVRALLVLEHIDTRQLQTQLRQLMVDNTGTRQIVPVGERALLLQGPASEMQGLAQLLREADAAAGRAAVPATAPAKDGER